MALWYPGTNVTLGTSVTLWHIRNFVALVQLLWERLGPRLNSWDQIQYGGPWLEVSLVKLKVPIFRLLSTFCAPSLLMLSPHPQTKAAKKNETYIYVVTYLVQKYNVIVSLTTKARGSFVKELRSSVFCPTINTLYCGFKDSK